MARLRHRIIATTSPVLTTVAAVIGAAGCTSSAAPPAMPKPPPVSIHSGEVPAPGAEASVALAGPPCRLVSRAAVAGAFAGHVTTDRAQVTAIGNTMCSFVLHSSNAGVGGTVSVTAVPATSRAEFRHAAVTSPHGRPLRGLGLAAFYRAADTSLELLRQRTRFVVQADLRVPGSAPAAPAKVRSDLIRLARSVGAA